jgi:hypothetical protein
MNELEGMWKEETMACEVVFQDLPGGTEENHTSLSQLVFRLRYEPRTF